MSRVFMQSSDNVAIERKIAPEVPSQSPFRGVWLAGQVELEEHFERPKPETSRPYASRHNTTLESKGLHDVFIL